MQQIDQIASLRCDARAQRVEIVSDNRGSAPGVIRKRPRIGIYDPSPSPSGQSRYVDGIMSLLDLNEFDVVIFGHQSGPYRSLGISLVDCIGRVDDPTSQENENTEQNKPGASSRTWRRFIPTQVRLWSGYARNSLRLASTLRKHPVDLLHTNNTGCEESAIAARLAGVPRILGTFHVDSTYDLHKTRSGFRYRIIEHLSNHSLHKAIAVSEATKRDWMRRTHLSRNRIVTIPNGVDLQKFRRCRGKEDARAQLGLPNGGRVLLGGIGRLHEDKGFSFLIEAIALLASEHRGCDLVIAGTGDLRATLELIASSLGVADRVHFLGFCQDVRHVYEALDIFVLSSLCEAMPYALLEATAMGLPVIACSVGGVPEVVAHEQTGYLVPPRDPHAIADAIQRLLSSTDSWERLGHAGRERCERFFDVNDSAKRTIEVYRNMLGLETTPE